MKIDPPCFSLQHTIPASKCRSKALPPVLSSIPFRIAAALSFSSIDHPLKVSDQYESVEGATSYQLEKSYDLIETKRLNNFCFHKQ